MSCGTLRSGNSCTSAGPEAIYTDPELPEAEYFLELGFWNYLDHVSAHGFMGASAGFGTKELISFLPVLPDANGAALMLTDTSSF